MSRLGLILNKSQCEKDCDKDKLEYFRKKILAHLSKLEKTENNTCCKALAVDEILKGGFPVGTIRDWKGKKYIKAPDGTWKPKYDGHTRGAKMAISAIKKRITEAKDAQEMLQICLNNRDRFSDRSGYPLPFVQELSKYVDEMQTQKQAAANKPKKVASSKKEEAKPKESEWHYYSEERIARIVESAKVQAEEATDSDLTRAYKNTKDTIDSGRTFYDGEMQKKKAQLPVIEKEMKKRGLLPRTEQEQKEFEQEEKENKKKIMETIHGEYWEILNSNDNEAEKLRKLKAANKRWGKEYGTRLNPEIFPEAIENQKNKSSGEEQKTAEKKGSFSNIQEKYKSAKVIEGDEDEIHIGKETITGKWKLVEADTPTASHDETSFHKTPGFPTNADGSTINDRDYGHDKAAQEAVSNIGADFDGRALKVDNPVVVTKDGIVISGNNRTMSSKLAARRGTDTKYIEALKKRAKKFGFTEDQISEFKNPRVIFETDQEGGYSTEQFAKFNESGKKEMGPTEKAVKVSKLIKTETVSTIAEKIGEFDTLGELYADKPAVNHIFAAFKNAGLIGENEAGKYMEEGTITEDGKTFIETALLGSVMSESNIRGFNRAGCKSIRGMLVRAITPLIENKSMTGYSINNELNAAVDIAMQVAINKDKFKNVEEFSKQQSMFEETNPVAVELAKKMEGTQKAFAEFMQTMNGGLKYAANGEADIFIGGVESRDDILNRFLSLKKAVLEVMKQIPMPELIKSLENLEG